MNTLRIYPKRIRKGYIYNIENSGITIPLEQFHRMALQVSFLATVLTSLAFFFFWDINILYSLPVFFIVMLGFYFYVNIKTLSRIRKMEILFPDLISLMASNLRAGMTIDRAFLLSSRKEFAPLDDYILKAGREITTGEDVVSALRKMSKQINSPKISKTVSVIISGLRAGGNISNILEQSSKNLKEKEFIEKRVTSNILMYIIFIVFAVVIGAPVLFGLSTVLVETVINLSANVPELDTSQVAVPLVFSNVTISPTFIVLFSLVFISITSLISSLLVGLVLKGSEKEGLRYFIPMLLVSVAIFFVIRIFLSGFFEGIFIQ